MSNPSSYLAPPSPAPASRGASPTVVGLDEFLARRDADLASILAAVRTRPGLDPDDVLLAVGSLVEGLGTTKSDLDLLLVTARAPEWLPPSEVVALVVGRSLVDLRVLRLEQLAALVGRFRSWADAPWSVSHAVKFSIDDRTLLHRVLHGKVLHGDLAGRLAARLPTGEELGRLKLHVARQASRTVLVDLVGYRDSGDHPSLAFGAQEVLGHAVDALVAAYGNTNPLLKWRTRLVASVPADWEEALRVRPTGLRAADRVWQLQRLPAAAEPDACHLHASRITCFARAVFAWSERRLARPDLPSPPPPHPWPGPIADGGPLLPFLGDDVDFGLGGGSTGLARLNEFDQPVLVSDEEFAMLLLFDGETRARQAERAVYGERPGGVGAAARLVARLAAAGMIAPRTPRGRGGL